MPEYPIQLIPLRAIHCLLLAELFRWRGGLAT